MLSPYLEKVGVVVKGRREPERGAGEMAPESESAARAALPLYSLSWVQPKVAASVLG